MRSKYFFMKNNEKETRVKTSKDGQGFIRAFFNKKYYTYIALKTMMTRAIF